jgi:hypothetical protein
MLRAARPDCAVTGIFKHGAQSGPPVPDFWRSVIVEQVKPSAPAPSAGPACASLPATTPATCTGRHNAYAAAAKCFPNNGWLGCADKASADICRAIDAFNFIGTEGKQLEACVLASPGGDRGLTRAKGAWFNNTNSCIWGHWRAAFDAIHDASVPVPSGLTPEWADAVTVCRRDGIGTSGCCQAHVVAEQNAIERCGAYDASLFGPLPTDVPGAKLCGDFAFLGSGGLPFTGHFDKVSDRISYGVVRCCVF